MKPFNILPTFALGLALTASLPSMAQTDNDSVFVYYKDGATVDKYSCTEIVKIAHDQNNTEVYTDLLGNDIPLAETQNKDIEKVVFKFAGEDNITVDINNLQLADKNASDATKILYAYMKYYYGKKIITSTVAKVNWNTTGAENVKKITCTYPAINCFDYIHIPFDGNWISYSDITPVTEWANKGGVVSLMWHFNVPANENDFNNNNYDALTCSPDKTTWDMDNIWKDGAWENKWFWQQMDKVATNILQLQDAGVVALWRPFHEASGNMLNNQGWTPSAWFWWGSKGGETYKKLWATMKNYFEERGIHNLIWIWTGTATTATNNSDESYYPGDDMVDIVGCDCYGSTANELKAQYDGLSTLYPSKMIALAECGNLTEDNGSATHITKQMPTISEMWNAGARFLYFMPWYDYYFEDGKADNSNMFAADYWKDAMHMQSVTMSNWGKK